MPENPPHITTPPPGEVTRLLEAVASGHEGGVDALFAATYGELKRLAGKQRRRWRGDETLSTTALIHEAYLKLLGQEGAQWEHRRHFFAVASRAMRQILMNYARSKQVARRGGDRRRETFEEHRLVAEEAIEDLLALDEALGQLAELDSRQARVVECRFFGGLTVIETADALDLSPATVKRDWTVARAYLQRALSVPTRRGQAGSLGVDE
ncbi:MAG TPA: sigma-70 family RNA polymerase sigma factor [Longimicrobiaceae bacterium]|nr:sigma-70 family RNA polymerase sigma factor [Longimicrobiaceae bacterium]